MPQNQKRPLNPSDLSQSLVRLAGARTEDTEAVRNLQETQEARHYEGEALRLAHEALTLRGSAAFNTAALATFNARLAVASWGVRR